MHINPLKLKTVMVPNEGTGEMKKEDRPMSWEDAAKVSAILMLAQIFIVFLPGHDFSEVANNLNQCIFELVIFSGQTFFANFIALTGLSIVTRKKS